MEYRLIHPWDMYVLVAARQPYSPTVIECDKLTYASGEGVAACGYISVIDDVTYLETTLVPAVIKEIP